MQTDPSAAQKDTSDHRGGSEDTRAIYKHKKKREEIIMQYPRPCCRAHHRYNMENRIRFASGVHVARVCERRNSRAANGKASARQGRTSVLSSSAESVPAILFSPSADGEGTGPCCDSSYRGGVCARTHTCMINYVSDGELYHHLLGATSPHTNTMCFCMSFMSSS